MNVSEEQLRNIVREEVLRAFDIIEVIRQAARDSVSSKYTMPPVRVEPERWSPTRVRPAGYRPARQHEILAVMENMPDGATPTEIAKAMSLGPKDKGRVSSSAYRLSVTGRLAVLKRGNKTFPKAESIYILPKFIDQQPASDETATH